jgi:hypothetical protein
MSRRIFNVNTRYYIGFSSSKIGIANSCNMFKYTTLGRDGFFFLFGFMNDTDLEGVVTYKQGTWIGALPVQVSVNTPRLTENGFSTKRDLVLTISQSLSSGRMSHHYV